MSDSEKLQIHIKSLFEELPEALTCSVEPVNCSRIIEPRALFEPDAQAPELTDLEPFIPIIVVPDDNGTYSIVDGYKRYLFYRNSNYEALTCTCIQTPLNEFEAGLLRIVLNSSRPRPLREKCQVLQWLQKQCAKDAFESTTRKAGFSPKEIEQIVPLLQSESHIQEAVFNGTIEISLIGSFKVLSSDDQRSFLNTFNKLKLSVQTQRELLEWLPEIAYTSNTTVRTILEDEDIRQVLGNTTRNAPQKIDQIRAFIYARKFPRLSEARTVWESQAKACNPDPGSVTFTPQLFFEENKLEVAVSLTDAQKAADIFKKLAAISPVDWQKLMYPCDPR